MEIRVYVSMAAFRSGKVLYCVRVSDPDGFDYKSCDSVLRCLYGRDIVVATIKVC